MSFLKKNNKMRFALTLTGTLASTAILLAGCGGGGGGGGGGSVTDQIDINFPTSSTTIERHGENQTFDIEMAASDVSLRTIELNGNDITSLFTKNGNQYTAAFNKVRGYLDDGSNTLRVTATNSSPDSVTFQANIASPDVIITNVSSTDPLPISGNASVQGVTRKSGLSSVTVNSVDMPTSGKSFNGSVAVVSDVSAAATSADYSIAATYSGGTTSTVEMLANGRPAASALALQINNGAYGPITDWIEEAIEAEFSKGGCGTGEDTSDCLGFGSSSIPKDFCELLFGETLGSTTTCESAIIIDGSQPLQTNVSLQSIAPTIDNGTYAFDMEVTVQFEKLTTQVILRRNSADRIETDFVWDIDGPSNQNEPFVYTAKLRGSVVAATDDNDGSLFSLSFEDVDNCTGINDAAACTFGANFGAPAVADTTCTEGNCSSITDADIRGRLITASGEIVKTIVDVSKDGLVAEDWDGSQETFVNISAGTSEAAPVAEGSSINQHVVSVPGSAAFAENQGGNGAFVEIGSGTAIANLDELTAADFHAILGSRYNGAASDFLTSGGRLGNTGNLAVALSENSLNQQLALQYATKQLDSLLPTIQGEDGLTAELNGAIGSNVVQDSELVFPSMSVPFVTLNPTDNSMRMTAQNIAMQVNVDVGGGMSKALTAAMDIEIAMTASVVNGELKFSVDSDSLAIDLVDVQGFKITGVPIIGEFDVNTIADDLRIQLLTVLPEQINTLIADLGDQVLPQQSPFLFDVAGDNAEIPEVLTSTLPKVFGLSLATDGVAVDGNHLVLRGSLEDVTGQANNNAFVSMCIYAGEDQKAQCPTE